MKVICKQCGKEFELTQEEIDFYKSKNLSIPKRCKECRDANKKTKVDENRPKKNQQAPTPVAPSKKLPTWASVLVAVLILFIVVFRPFGEQTEQPAQEAPVSQTITQNAGKEVTFRNAKLLAEHYEKHGEEMGFSSAAEYEKAAAEVVSNPNSLHKLEEEDGDDVYYLEDTNDFVIVSTDGYIRTYFRPDKGIKYFNGQ